jgi:hypothetical protein
MAERAEQKAAEQVRRVERIRLHKEYLARCIRRAADARRRYSLRYVAIPRGERLDGPGPMVHVGPATQPTSRSSQPEVQPSSQPDRYACTHNMAAKLVAALSLQPDSLEPDMELAEQVDQPGPRYCIEDYAQPERTEGRLSSQEDRHMSREDTSLYDESQLAQLSAYEEGTSSLMVPTHATMAARALCGCRLESEPRCPGWTQPASERWNSITIAEGAKPGSASRATLRRMCKCGGSSVLPSKRKSGILEF